jgi:hypothetical protein
MIRLRCEAGVLLEMPLEIRRPPEGKCWVATIRIDRAAPGGVARQFWGRAPDFGTFLVPDDIRRFAPLEFGGDLVSGQRITRVRRYGVFFGCPDGHLTFTQYGDAKACCTMATAFGYLWDDFTPHLPDQPTRAREPPAEPTPDAERKIIRLNRRKDPP